MIVTSAGSDALQNKSHKTESFRIQVMSFVVTNETRMTLLNKLKKVKKISPIKAVCTVHSSIIYKQKLVVQNMKCLWKTARKIKVVNFKCLFEEYNS